MYNCDRSFEIRENGELILRTSTTINGSLARLVAVASDSGRPPRYVYTGFSKSWPQISFVSNL